MAALIESDVWRDGGSLSATVLDGDSRWSFWLQTNQWNHPGDRGHENLFISAGDDPLVKEQRVEISSADERRYLDYLLQVETTKASEDSRTRFREMIHVLESRQEGAL